MTVSVNTSGSQDASVGVEYSLATITSPNVYELNISLGAMIGGSTPDILEIGQYGKVRSSDSEELIKIWTIVGGQTEKHLKIPPLISPHYARFTLKLRQSAQSPAIVSFPWAIYQVQ